jgi:hypothetical protein
VTHTSKSYGSDEKYRSVILGRALLHLASPTRMGIWGQTLSLPLNFRQPSPSNKAMSEHHLSVVAKVGSFHFLRSTIAPAK